MAAIDNQPNSITNIKPIERKSASVQAANSAVQKKVDPSKVESDTRLPIKETNHYVVRRGDIVVEWNKEKEYAVGTSPVAQTKSNDQKLQEAIQQLQQENAALKQKVKQTEPKTIVAAEPKIEIKTQQVEQSKQVKPVNISATTIIKQEESKAKETQKAELKPTLTPNKVIAEAKVSPVTQPESILSKAFVAALKPALVTYEPTYGIKEKRLSELLTQALYSNFDQLDAAGKSAAEKVIQSILSTCYVKQTIDNKTYYLFKPEHKNLQLADVVKKVANLSADQQEILAESLVQLYTFQPLEDIAEIVIKAEDLLSKEKLTQPKETELFNCREAIKGKIVWLRANTNPQTSTGLQQALQIKNNSELFLKGIGEVALNMNYLKKLSDLEKIEKKLTSRLNDGYDEVTKRIEVLEGKQTAKTDIKDDNLTIHLEKNKAVMINSETGQKIQATFGEADDLSVDTEKILFKDESKAMLAQLGISIDNYSTIAKDMPFLKYMGKERDISETKIAGEYYEAYMGWLKNQKNVPPQLYKQLNNLKSFAKGDKKIDKSLCLMTIFTTSLYAALRIAGIATVFAFNIGDTAILDRVGAISLAIGEFAVRLPASKQFNSILFNTYSSNNERFAITPKELADVRGEFGPPAGFNQYTVGEAYVFKAIIETGFLTRLGYWNFTGHHYSTTVMGLNDPKLISYTIEKDKLMTFIKNLNSQIKDSWLDFENNLHKENLTGKTSFNKALNLNCTDLTSLKVTEKQTDLLKKEYQRLAGVYQSIAKEFRQKEEFFRTYTSEWSRQRIPNATWFERIGEVWGANARDFENKAKECLRYGNQVDNIPADKQASYIQKNLTEIRAQYREYEHKFHHNIFLFASGHYRRIDFDFYVQVENHLKAKLSTDLLAKKLDELYIDKIELQDLINNVNSSLEFYNCDKLSAADSKPENFIKILKGYQGNKKDLTIEDILPQIIADNFNFIIFSNKGKGEDQSKLYQRFGKTVYLSTNSTGKLLEFSEEEFNKYSIKFLNKANWTKEEWDALTQEEWVKLGEFAKLFPIKPERRDYPPTRFNYSMDKDYFPFSIDPETGERKDFAEMVAYQLRAQKEGQVNVTVLQGKQNYLYDSEYEKLSQAANDDQKPWYGSFVFSSHIQQLFARLQVVKDKLGNAQKQDEYINILCEMANNIKHMDKSSSQKIWPQAAYLLTKKSDLGLTENDLDEILTLQNKASSKLKAKIDYRLLNFWIGNLYQFLLEFRDARGMALGKNVDMGMFNCGTCRLEDIQLHRLAIQLYQLQNVSCSAGRLGNEPETHALITLNNETKDIEEYMPRERLKLNAKYVNPLVDLHKVSDKDLANLLNTFLVNSKESISIQRTPEGIEIYNNAGERIFGEYDIQIENVPTTFTGITKRYKLVIRKNEYNDDGSIKSQTPYKALYQYYKDTDVGIGDLENILGVQETRPEQRIGALAINVAGMGRKVKGILYLKPNASDKFLFDEAIKTEADLEVALRKEDPEVIENMKGLFRKYQASLNDRGTVIIDYTQTGKIVTDYVPRLKNTRYVTYFDQAVPLDIINHTAGTTDIDSQQIFDLLEQIENHQHINIKTADEQVFIQRDDSQYHVELTRKDGTKDIFLVKGNENKFVLLKNGKEQANFPADNKGVSIDYSYFSGAKKALAGKIKQIIAEKDFTVELGEYKVDSKQMAECINNPHLLNRTIYLGQNINDTITFSGRSFKEKSNQVFNGFNCSFNFKDACQIKFGDELSEKTIQLLGADCLDGLNKAETKDQMFIWKLLNIAAESTEKETKEKDAISVDGKGYQKKGLKWQNILLRNNGQISHDLRIGFVTKDEEKYLIVKDIISDKEIIFPISNNNTRDAEKKISEELNNIKAWFKDAQVDVVDLVPQAGQKLLKLRFADNPVAITKTRDRSNLSLMLLNIREIGSTGQFKFIKTVNGQQKEHHLTFNSTKVTLDDVVYTNYETAVKKLDQLLFDGNGDVKIESKILMPNLISKMIKTDDKGNVLFEREMSTVKQTMPDWWITEDASSTFEQQRRGFKISYAPYHFSDGLGPETMNELYNQHRRWALGTINSFSSEELKKHPLFTKTPAGVQLGQNENWYKHGPYDESLYLSPVLLSNSMIAAELINPMLAAGKFSTFNPVASDTINNNQYFWNAPLTAIIVAVGLVNVFFSVYTYYRLMKDQPSMKKNKTSIKDIFIKESLIGFLGSNCYKDALEGDRLNVDAGFDVTMIGGEKEPIPYSAVKETNARLAYSMYATTVFTALYIKALATQGLMGMISPVGFSAGIVGFWSILNMAKLLTGIGSFDGFQHYWDSWWKSGFFPDAENNTMQIQNERAEWFDSLDNIEKSLAIAETNIVERIADNNGSGAYVDQVKQVTKANIGNFSNSLDFTVQQLLSDNISIKEMEKGLELILKVYTLGGQSKAGLEFIERFLDYKNFSSEDMATFKKKFTDATINLAGVGNAHKTLISANARPSKLGRIIEKFKQEDVAIKEVIANSAQLHFVAAKACLANNLNEKALVYLKNVLQNIEQIESTQERARLFSRTEKFIIEAYQRLAIAHLKDKDNNYSSLAQEAIDGNKSPAELVAAFPSFNKDILAALCLLREKAISKVGRKIMTERLYNTKRFNQALILSKQYEQTKNIEFLNQAYQNFSLLTKKSIEMDMLGAKLLNSLSKVNNKVDLKTQLINTHLVEVNNLLKELPVLNAIEIKAKRGKAYSSAQKIAKIITLGYAYREKDSYIPSFVVDKQALCHQVESDLASLNSYLSALKKKYNLASVKTLKDVERILTANTQKSKLKNDFLGRLNEIKGFLPALQQIDLNENKKIDIDSLSSYIKNAVKEKVIKIKSLIYRLAELADLGSVIELDNNNKTGELELKITQKASKKSNVFTVKFSPNKDTTEENLIWAQNSAQEEQDAVLKQQKLLLRKQMCIGGTIKDVLPIKGIHKNEQERIAKLYVLEREGGKVKKDNNGFLNTDYQKTLVRINARHIQALTKNIIDRLVDLGRYDEALKFYSYYIPTLKLTGKQGKVNTIGDFIEAAIARMEEHEKKDDLKAYLDFLIKYGDKLTLKNNVPISFTKIHIEKDEKTKKEIKTIANQRTVKEEIDFVKNHIQNFGGETLDAKELNKYNQEIDSKYQDYAQKTFLKKQDYASFIEYLAKTDIAQANNLLSYLRENKKGNLTSEVCQSLEKIKQAITQPQFIEMMAVFAKRIKADVTIDKRSTEVKERLENFFKDLVAKQAVIPEVEKDSLEKLFASYLMLQTKGFDVDLNLIKPVYADILKRDPTKSTYLQSVTHYAQDYFEDRLANSILYLKSKSFNEVTDTDKAEFNLILNKILVYGGFFTKTLYPHINLKDNSDFKDIKACFRLINLTSGKLNQGKIIHYLSELADISKKYDIDFNGKNLIVNSMNTVKSYHKPVKLTAALEYEYYILKSMSLLGSVEKINQQYQKIINLLIVSNKADFLALPKQQRSSLVHKILFTTFDQVKNLLKDNATTASEKANAVIHLDELANQFLNGHNEALLELPNPEVSRWEIELQRFEAKTLVYNLLEKGSINIEQVAQLRAAGLTGYTKDELVKFATSAMVVFAQKIEQATTTAQEEYKLQNNKKQQADASVEGEYLLPSATRKLIATYQHLSENLLKVVSEQQLVKDFDSKTLENSNQKNALAYLVDSLKTGLQKISKKVVSLNKWDNCKFSDIDKKEVDLQNLKPDVQKVKEAYNTKKPENLNDDIAEIPVQKPTKFQLWKKQQASAFHRWKNNMKVVWKKHKLYWLNKAMNHVVLWGSIGLVATPLVMLIPGATVALGGTFGIGAICTVIGVVVLPLVKKLGEKIFWSIYASITGKKAKDKIKDKI